jgi:two-component system, LytTR family, response regulator
MSQQATMPATNQHTRNAVLRTIIADDERLAREKLRIFLSSEPDIEIMAECQDGEQTIAAIRIYHADLVLLDIQMPRLDGFQVLEQLRPEEMPVIIFTTAYDQYALRAFEAHALDYLLKPFDQERFHRALQRARELVGSTQERELTQRILSLLSQVRSDAGAATSAQDRLVIRAKGRIVFLNLDEIDWIQASANYVRLNVGKESHLVRETIGRIAERLNPNHFVRIHRSTIVDVRKIKELIPVNSGEYIVVLTNGKELSCSRGYRTALQKMIEKTS